MTHNEFHEMHENMQTGPVSTKMNHGANGMIGIKDVLGSVLATLNQATLFRPHVKDPELLDIMDRQYRFMLDEYNITVECFKSGTDPSHPTGSYNMKQENDFVYGTKPSQPKKPMQSANELNDEMISGFMLGAMKNIASLKTTSAIEVTHPVVRRVLADSIANCIEMAYELSIYQNKHHYYQIPQLSDHDMQEMMNSFAGAQGQPGMPMQ
ncbi:MULTISPECIES: spore coat protein [Sporosarcina]|uniref:Spore coat protein n=1 Tax=Sporosarcina saromensis TaxID=359365 RepID=A0ABU4G6Z4_9BACL|nr:spore coat protein [Sporosarcina saromensis]MDW0112753.1 spore coat protein [Sporosarcina saromensis]